MSIKFDSKKNRYRVSIGSGSSRLRRFFETKREANNFALEVSLGSKSSPSEPKLTKLSKAIQDYHELVSKTKSKGSFVNEKRIFNWYFHVMVIEREKHYIGQVTSQDLLFFQRWLLESHEELEVPFRKLSPATVNRWFASIKHFFNTCIQWELLEASPARFIKKLEEYPRIKIGWTDEQVEAVKLNCPGWFRDIFYLVHLTGLRPSSIARLKWADISLEAGVLIGTSLKGPKLIRWPIPITEPVRKILLKRGPCEADQPVFRGTKGVAISAATMVSTARKAIRRTGLRGMEWYSLKHTLASEMISVGISTEHVRRLLGHRDSRMVERHYGQMVPNEALKRSLSLVRGLENGHQTGT